MGFDALPRFSVTVLRPRILTGSPLLCRNAVSFGSPSGATCSRSSQFRDADTVNATLVAQEFDRVRCAMVLHDTLPLAGIPRAAPMRDLKTPISWSPAVSA